MEKDFESLLASLVGQSLNLDAKSRADFMGG